MKLFFWRKGEEKERDVRAAPRTAKRMEPLTDSWESRILNPDAGVALTAITDAAKARDPKALPALIRLVKSGDPIGDEAIDIIPLIILLNPGHPEIIAMVPGIEKKLDPHTPCDEMWVMSAISEANKGMFSGMVPQLLRMLHNFQRSGEFLALKDVVMILGNIGDKRAILPVEKLLESGAGDDELREMASYSLMMLRTKTVYIN